METFNSYNSGQSATSEDITKESYFVKKYILSKFAEKFNSDPEHLDLNENLLDIGLDSSVVVKIAEEFEQELDIKLYPTVFFEYKSLQEIIGYFTAEFSDKVIKYYSSRQTETTVVEPTTSFVESDDILEKISQFLKQRIAPILEIHPEQINMEENLLDLGLGSSSLVGLAEELEKDVKLTLYPTVFFEYQNLTSIADYFARDFKTEFENYFTSKQTVTIQQLKQFQPQKVSPISTNSEEIAKNSIISIPAENIHAYTLQWEKETSSTPTITSGQAVLLMVNDSSEIKKHLFRKAFEGINISPLREESFSVIEGTPYQFILYVNEDHSLLSGTGDASRLIESVYFSLQTLVKKVSEIKTKSKYTITIVVESSSVLNSPLLLAFRGLMKSVSAEIPFIKANTIGLEAFNSDSLDWIKTQIYTEDERCCVKLKNENYQLMPAPIKFSAGEAIILKDNSSYIISGGSGKLGQLVAKHIASKAKCTVILLGRKAQLAEAASLSSKGNVIYRSCDVKDRIRLKEIINEVGTLCGPVKGIIHAAGIVNDGQFLGKTEAQLRNVVETKIEGLINLDHAAKDQPLDFFVGFSSLSSFMGNRGQSDYSTANGFMDGYLRKRQSEADKGLVKGRSISINWPLWESGGMMPHQMVIDMMEKAFGISLLSNADGLYAYDRIMAGTVSQVCVIKGQKEKFEKLLGKVSSGTAGIAVTADVISKAEISIPDKKVKEKGIPSLEFLTSQWGTIRNTFLPNPKAFLGDGDVSIELTKLLDAVNKHYQLTIPATVITQVQTLSDIHSKITQFLSPKEESISKETVVSEDEYLKDIQRPVIQKIDALQTKVEIKDIAIIGMDGRFPESPDVHAFWKNLEEERDMVTETPAERIKWWKVISEFLKCDAEEDFLLSGGYLKDVDKFDADFFKISAREAEVIDPQQRLFLESVWKCIQDAGYAPQSLSGTKTGVFAAVSTRDYHELLIINGVDIEPQHSTGLAHSILPNRVSYWLNLHGPSEAIDTACSSSLVALNRAVQAIHNGDCEQAIVGGVNLVLSPLAILAFGKTGILGKDGRCKTFDKSANGYARGEGVGSVFLKPLNQAIADGDVIHGVIKGTSVNHGGRGNSLTAPNPALQADVITQAIRRSGCDINTINYIEAHGTGTALGDPVEIEGLKRAFRTLQKEQNISSPGNDHCGIGAVKSNIGHLEAAAGIAGLIKVLMALKHKKIPASLHIQEINPFINLNSSPFYIARNTHDWPKVDTDVPRRAGLSSFGFGGTNAHVILEEYIVPKIAQQNSINKTYIFPFSAPSASQLIDYLTSFLKYLNEASSEYLNTENIAHTLQLGRPVEDFRCAFTAHSVGELRTEISNFIKDTDKASLKVIPDVSRNLLKDPKNTLVETLYRNGNLQELSQLWLQGINIDWKLLNQGAVKKLSLPTFPLLKNTYWLTTPTSRENIFNSLLDKEEKTIQIETQEPSSNASDIRKFLVEEISSLLKKDPMEISSSVSLMNYGLDSILGMTLVKKIEQKLNMPVYVNEILQYETIDKLSAYLQQESSGRKVEVKTDVRFAQIKEENESGEKLSKPAVFLLSTPRSGSTLLRSMLMGNTHLFAPPELHLLNFSNLKERKLLIGNSGFGDGLIETIKTLKNISIEEAKVWIENHEQNGISVKEMYNMVQDMAGNMMLVDKSPSYASDINVLRKAEKQFANARYLFLIRHPYAVMESIVRNRFHKFIPGSESDPDKSAENIWYDFNKNIIDFISELPQGKAMTVYYEDLIADPELTLTAISDFLQIPFEEAMLNPYQGERLIKGLHENSMSVGDPNFLKHDSVKKEFASAWKSAYKILPSLNDQTIKFASKLGYDTGQDLALSPVQKDFLTSDPFAEKWILSHEFSFKLENRKIAEYESLKSAAEKLVQLHPVFERLYDRNEEKLRWNPDAEQQVCVHFEDLLHVDASNQDFIIQQKSSEVLDKIDITNGPILGISLFKTDPFNYRGVLTYHHFFGDGITSVTILKNLISLLNGTIPGQHSVCESYFSYLEKLNEGSIAFNASSPSNWNLPVDNESGSNNFEDQRELRLTLSLEQSEESTLNLFFNIGASLALALGRWTNISHIPMDIRYHGRSISGHKESFMETAGFFAYDLPVIINLSEGNPLDSFNLGYQQARSNASYSPYTNFNSVRFNFQPYNRLLSEETEIILNNSVEFLDPQRKRKNQLDCIVRAGHNNKLEFIVRYSQARYNLFTIESFLNTWVTEFNNSLNMKK